GSGRSQEHPASRPAAPATPAASTERRDQPLPVRTATVNTITRRGRGRPCPRGLRVDGRRRARGRPCRCAFAGWRACAVPAGASATPTTVVHRRPRAGAAPGGEGGSGLRSAQPAGRRPRRANVAVEQQPRGWSAMTPQGRGAGARAQAARVSALVEPVVRDAGFDLEKVTVKRVGRRHVVRLVIDGDRGVDLDSVAAVSRSGSSALEEAEAAGQTRCRGGYVLEVSSPGTDRPLTEPRHWRRNVGRLVTVRVREADGERTLTGRVVAADGSEVTLEVDGEPRRLPLSALGAGRVQVELRRLDEVPGGEEEGESR